MTEPILTYMETPLHRYTFKNKKIREWVESRCKGKVLNLFAGQTKLNVDEIRNDIDETMLAASHMEAREFVKFWAKSPTFNFNTIVLDPPYSYRKSMEFYNGHKASKFKILLDALSSIMEPDGRIIKFGYSSSKEVGFKKVEVLTICHGGAYHDTIALVEDRNI